MAAGVYPVEAATVRQCEELQRAVGALHTAMVAGLAAARPRASERPSDEGTDWDPSVSEFASDEAAALLELHPRTAAGRLREATGVATETPCLLQSLGVGLLSSSGVRTVTSELAALPPELRGGAAEQVLVLARAFQSRGGLVTPGRLAAWTRRVVIELDPAAADRRARRAQATRGIYLRVEDDGMASLSLVDRADRTLVTWTLIDQLARTAAPLCGADPTIDTEAAGDLTRLGGQQSELPDKRTLPAKRMDAARFLLTTHPLVTGQPFPLHLMTPTEDSGECGQRSTTGGSAESSTGSSTSSGTDTSPGPGPGPAATDTSDAFDHTRPPTAPVAREDLARLLDATPALWRSSRVLVEVAVPVTSLTGQDDAVGLLTGYGPIPPGLAAQIASETTWRRLLTDPATGAVLDVGRTQYRPTAAMAAFVTSRDRTCRCGCGVPARRCDLDHTVPFPTGPTSVDNLAPLERRAHRRKQHPRWHLTRTGDTYTWVTPGGRRFSVLPEAVGPILRRIVMHPHQLPLTLEEPPPEQRDDPDDETDAVSGD